MTTRRKTKRTITLKECSAIFKAVGTPENIIRHCKKVSEAASFLAKKLAEKNITVDIDAVRKAALIHDALRYVDIKMFDLYAEISEDDKKKIEKFKKRYNGLTHEEAMQRFIKENFRCKKCEKIADIVRKHCYPCVVYKSLKPKTWEEKIVNYADKRVAHAEIVSLKERFNEGHKRNKDKGPINGYSISYIDSLYFKMEKEIFSIIKLNPEKLNYYIEKEQKTKARKKKAPKDAKEKMQKR